MATVKEIAPHALQPEHLRVAAYCRVSSDSEDQLHSYAAQIRNYTEVIAQHDGWDLVDVYADEGLTGTRVDKRDDFNRMMRDCRKGKIDCILVKSVARFARNTKECLASLRELSGMGVTVRFEKENIDTGTLTTELMVSVSGSLAQQESLSISANQRLSTAWNAENSSPAALPTDTGLKTRKTLRSCRKKRLRYAGPLMHISKETAPNGSRSN